jgi:hypothetical protein
VRTPNFKRPRTFFRVRVAVLLTILGGVLLWAWRDLRSRRERNTWERPLSVAIVLVRCGPIDDAAVAAFRARVPALDMRLAEEYHRYRSRAEHPFVFSFVGPVDAAQGPPRAGGDGLIDAARETWALWRWTSRVDRAAGIDSSVYDSRVYVAARPPASEERMMVEGESEGGGRLGTVEVELDAAMADFALFVTTHELLHTLGASDKYDSAGRTLVPAGLGEPDRVPLLPQVFVEVMARNRPVAPGVERPPENLEQLAVGPATATEIGWIAIRK